MNTAEIHAACLRENKGSRHPVPITASEIQTDLNFADSLPELFAGQEMGEDALHVLRECLKIRARTLTEIATELPHGLVPRTRQHLFVSQLGGTKIVSNDNSFEKPTLKHILRKNEKAPSGLSLNHATSKGQIPNNNEPARTTSSLRPKLSGTDGSARD